MEEGFTIRADFSSQHQILPNRMSDSLALSSYLKLRQENRVSPHQTNSSNKKTLFEEYKFEENGSVEEDIDYSDNRSERSLLFTENLTDMSELDFKAMRLLVHTSLHEKEQAQAKQSLLEDEVSYLMRSMARMQSQNYWKLPLMLKKSFSKVQGRKQHSFQVWKDKTMAYKVAQVLSSDRTLILKLARRNILKVRLVYTSRAFNRWNIQNKHDIDTVTRTGKQVAQRHKKHVLNSIFDAFRKNRLRMNTLRRLNRIARLVLFRSCVSHWRQCVSDSHRRHVQQLQCATKFSSVVRMVVTARRSVKKAFVEWSSSVQAQRLRCKLAVLCNQRLNLLIGKYANPVHLAFTQWKQLTTCVYSNLQLAATVWLAAHRKCATFLVRKALLTWKDKCGRFRTVTRRIAGYLASQRTSALRGAFSKLVAAQQEHLRGKVKGGLDRWMRQFFRTVDTSSELHCRNVLSARFRHWHHATHTERHTTHFQGQLQELHGQLHRTASNLQQEMDHKRELEQRHRQTEQHYRERLVSSKLRHIGRVVANMELAGKAKALRTWLRYSHWHQQQEAMTTVKLSERMKRVHGTLARWFKQMGVANLHIALWTWKYHCRRASKLEQLQKTHTSALSRSTFQSWKKATFDARLQRKVLTRMFRDKRLALKHLAWDTWVKKVAHVKDKCRTFVRITLSKRHSQVRIAFCFWKKIVADEVLRWERETRQRKEGEERVLTLRFYWHQFCFGLSQQRAENRFVIQVVVAKMMSKLKSGFDRWYHSAKRLTRLRNVCINLSRVYAHTLGKRHLLCFAKWKAVVWDFQKIGYRALQSKLADAQERIQVITEQQLELESSASHLRAHNERADRIARTLYHQVHRMLANRRLHRMVKLTFNCWKANHELLGRMKVRVKRYLVRSQAGRAARQLASGFRTWLVAIQVAAREEQAAKLQRKTTDFLCLRQFFDRWQSFRSMRRMQMMSVITRLKSGIQAGVGKTLASAFNTWRTGVHEYLAFRCSTLRDCFDKWREDIVICSRKRKVINRLFPKLNAASMKQYFKKWVEHTRILRLMCDTIVRMLEVSHLNRSYVSTVRLRSCWNRWWGIVSHCNNQIKACRMIVQCYRKILRSALFAWRHNCDQQHSIAQARRMTMKKLLQLARFHALSRFYIWRSVAQQLKVAEDHVNRMGMVLKRMRLIRKLRRSWTSWRTLFKQLNSPVTSTGATLKIHGPKYVNAITRSQYWSSSLLRCVLVSTSVEPVLELALEALRSVLPEFVASLYYVHHQHEYLWGLTSSSQLRSSSDTSYLNSPSRASPLSMDRTATALKRLQLSRKFSPVPHDDRSQGPEFFPVGTREEQNHNQHNLQHDLTYFGLDAEQTPLRLPEFSGSPSKASPVLYPGSKQRNDGFPSTTKPSGSRVEPSTTSSGTTVLLGEGLVGRCAQQRFMQVFRQGVVTNGTYSQSRVYCSTNVPVPEHSFNICVNNAAADKKDTVATAVLPIVWGGNVVAVVQLTAPNLDPRGVYFNVDDLSVHGHQQQGLGQGQENSRTSLEAKNKAIKHMSLVLRDLLDFSDVNATDADFATSFSANSSSGGGGGATHQQQSLLSRARTLRGQMMYQLLQLCVELRLDEEKSVGFIAIISTIAEILGRHFPAAQPVPMSATGVLSSFANTPGGPRSGLSDYAAFSPRREDIALQPHFLSTTKTINFTSNTSFVGLAHYFSQSATDLHRADTLQHSLLQETENLNRIVERLKQSRAKYLHRAEELESELQLSRASLEEERKDNKKLAHSMKRTEARIKVFEQQQQEIGKLNNIMRSAAHAALYQK